MTTIIFMVSQFWMQQKLMIADLHSCFWDFSWKKSEIAHEIVIFCPFLCTDPSVTSYLSCETRGHDPFRLFGLESCWEVQPRRFAFFGIAKVAPVAPPQVASSEIRRTSRARKKEVPFIWWYLNRFDRGLLCWIVLYYMCCTRIVLYTVLYSV